MITLPRGRTFRLVTIGILLLFTFFFLHSSLTDPEGIPSNGGMAEKARLNRLLHQPGSPYTRADLSYSKKAGLELVSVDNVSRNASTGTPGTTPRVKAAIVMLARNGDANGAASSILQLQKRFNDRYNYPFVFLNERPFDDAFKARMREVAPQSKLMFGLIPVEHWSFPPWIDQERAARVRKEMHEANIIYGGSEPYRHMCRYNSGFFFRHPLLDEFDYYWRVEPDVDFHCDIQDDPFRYMQEHNKLYGFTISLFEYGTTIETLWKTSRDFMKEQPHRVRSDNSLRFLHDGNIEDYNRCHFWSNFEIASLHLWRSQAYLDYFDHLDKAGGFFYERWGDAPVHSIGAAMILKPDQIHFFNDIGYYHGPFRHCPVDQPAFKDKCQCNGNENFDMQGYSCTRKWFELYGGGDANIEAERVRVVNEEAARVAKEEAERKEKAKQEEEDRKKKENEEAAKRKEEEDKAAQRKKQVEADERVAREEKERIENEKKKQEEKAKRTEDQTDATTGPVKPDDNASDDGKLVVPEITVVADLAEAEKEAEARQAADVD
ncbi:alpha 1,2-mannosyltransferase 2.4.1 [Thoreauomyces humboldtii]|nr:alpha 1,2-mannosyltransferase 2.4.1 [Thoreauomyces humboldtii]